MKVSSALDTQEQLALAAVPGLKDDDSIVCRYAAMTLENPKDRFAYQGRLE